MGGGPMTNIICELYSFDKQDQIGDKSQIQPWKEVLE